MVNSNSLFNSKFISRLLPTVLVAVATAVSISGISSNKPSSIEPLVSLDERPKIPEEEIQPEEEDSDSGENDNSNPTPPSDPNSAPSPQDNQQTQPPAAPEQKEQESKDSEQKDNAQNAQEKQVDQNLTGDRNNSEPTKEDVINRLKEEIEKLKVHKEAWNNNPEGLLTNFNLITSLGDITSLITQYQEIEKKAKSQAPTSVDTQTNN